MMRIAILRSGTPDARDYFAPYVFPQGQKTETCDFVDNPSEGQFDGIVVPQSVTPLGKRYDLVCPPTRTLCALLEPPDIITLPDEYTQQFHTVVGPDARVACKNRLLSAAGHHWFVELTAEQATRNPIMEKPRLLSAIVSSKQDTLGHRTRWTFMKQLKDHFGDQLDWFGRGVRDTGPKKLSALAAYKYHIVLENGQWPHYWTEKLSDAYMSNSFPFYWGAPNISDYFSPQSYCPIDPYRPAAAIAAIENVIDAGLWEKRQGDLARTRNQVVTDYHPYSLWRSILESLPSSDPVPIAIKPFDQCRFSARQRIRFRLRNLLQGR